MPRMVIEFPEEFTEVGKAMAGHLAALQQTVSRLGGGKAVDYAEVEKAMSESAGRTELAGHCAIPSVGRAWRATRRAGSGCGKPAGGCGGGRLAATRGAGDGPCGAARPVAGSGSERAGVWPPAIFARQFREGGAPACRCRSQDIEDALIDAVEVPEQARSTSVSLDRVSVPMEEPRRRPEENRWNETSAWRIAVR